MNDNQPERRLHIGCGTAILPGWTNIDIEELPGVDLVHDVRDGIPFDDVELIFAEHFIEHLSFHAGLAFIRDCRRVLNDAGVLRLSTPNLDWVWLNQYHHGAWSEPAEAVRDCFWMNKAFRGWGHRFLYNRQTLTEVLVEGGFGQIKERDYGKSDHVALQGLECHEQYIDTSETPHIIVLEASGRSETPSARLAGPRSDYESAVGIED
jgi:predicted SAM-dependent methyltransferase